MIMTTITIILLSYATLYSHSCLSSFPSLCSPFFSPPLHSLLSASASPFHFRLSASSLHSFSPPRLSSPQSTPTSLLHPVSPPPPVPFVYICRSENLRRCGD